MSSNYRILAYFLSTLNESLRISLGLRNTRNFYNRLGYSARQNKNAQSTRRFNGEELNQSRRKVSGNAKPNVNAASIYDNFSIVAEGIKQYANYTASHAVKRSGQLTEYTAYRDPFPIAEADVKEKIYSTTIPPVSKRDSGKSSQSEFKSPVTLEHQQPAKDASAEPVNKERKRSDRRVIINSSNNKNSIYNQNSSVIENAKESKIPSNRTARVLSFGGLAVSLGVGALEEFTKRVVGASTSKKDDSILGSSLFLSEANAHKIVDTLCRVRGAALKLGQMLSIQDSEVVGPEIQAIFERVRQSADYMPVSQMRQVMDQELGDQWKSLFKSFDEKPFAAASIGQVHRAQLPSGEEVAVKIQYPGVAESIESDIKNVLMILKYANIFPEGLFIDHIMAYAKKELSWEVDYVREAACATKYRSLIEKYADPKDHFHVPVVYEQLSSKRVITSELIRGISIDKLDDYLETSSQEVKNSILQRLLKLFFQELFVFNYMQTDPNWSNFFYDYDTDTISLIDFGSSRPYSPDFVRQYFDIIQAAIESDREKVLSKSQDIGFLSGFEAEAFKVAHVDSVMIIGESIRHPGKFNFGRQSVTKQIHNLVPVMLRHRLKPPPEEIYSLHRKLSGLFLLFTKLKAEIDCRSAFEETTRGYDK